MFVLRYLVTACLAVALVSARPLEVPEHLTQRSTVASVFATTITSSLELPSYKPLM